MRNQTRCTTVPAIVRSSELSRIATSGTIAGANQSAFAETNHKMNKLLDLYQKETVLLLDGAMGTELFARGLVSGGSPEEWNVTHPERVQDVHRAYVAAGSDIILTNSFGGTRYRLKLHNFQDRVVELNCAAAQNARAAAAAWFSSTTLSCKSWSLSR